MLLVAGATGWGIATILLAFVDNLKGMIILRIVNGVALGVLSPTVQSIIASEVEPGNRGFQFGCLGFFKTGFGAVATSLIATSISNKQIGSISGWRVAFVVIGMLTIIVALIVSRFFEERPRKLQLTQISIGEELSKVYSYFRKIPTFGIVVCQGMFGCIPFTALAFQTMFLQYVGISDFNAALITALNISGCGLGMLLGGAIGDFAAHHSPDHGRVFTAQLSTMLSMPLVILLFALVPRDAGWCGTFAALAFSLGLVCSWCDSGCNRPIFCEIVPASSCASAFSWLYCIEWSLSQLVGYSAFSFMSDHFFGYEPVQQEVIHMSPARRQMNADALGKSLLLSCLVPWAVAFLVYSLVHYTYKHDRIDVCDVAAEDRPSEANHPCEASPLC